MFQKARLLVAIAALIVAGLGLPGRCWALGPNLLINGGFEAGSQQFKTAGAFSIVNDATNARTGSWLLSAKLNHSGDNADESMDCWSDTGYTTTLWCRGTGKVTVQILSSDWKTVVASQVISGGDKWKQSSLTWNSGSNSNVILDICDNVGAGTMYFDDFYTGLTDGQTISFDGLQPGKSKPKFSLLFDDEFASSSTIDVNNTGATGYNWYLKSFYGSQFDNNSSMFSVGDGGITFTDCGNSFGEGLNTAHPSSNSQGFIGTVFGGGQGMYAEAKIEMMNIDRIKSDAWPAFWSNDIKGNTGKDKAMPGNPGHVETIENDYMEYNPNWGSSGNWYSTMHDWGDPGVNIGNNNSVITPPVGTDYTKFHTYGMLWVPASAANGWNGYRQAYFDGQPQQAVCWKGNQIYKGPFPPTRESMGSYLFSLTDQDQFCLILGSCQHGFPSMKVAYVRVWAVNKSSMTVVK